MMQVQMMDTQRPVEPVRQFHEGVKTMCIARLAEALNPSTAIFDRQLRHRQWSDTIGTEDLTSTAICLISLSRASVDPAEIGLDESRTFDALLEVTRRRAYAGGLGLVIWANAVTRRMPLADLLMRAGMSLTDPAAVLAPITTMEAAWMVSGLVHEHRRAPDDLAADALNVAIRELLGRYEPATKIFRHASDAAPLRHRARKWVANFADQVYAVQALGLVALAQGNEHALESADRCASRLVELQGGLGQWWWHYDPRDGRVAQAYPVYSVHQHAMAPMALMTLAAAGGTDHVESIERSHDWISRNELGIEMVDDEAGTIWRNIEAADGVHRRFFRKLRSLAGWKQHHTEMDLAALVVNYETRPYEWAWCLFAGAIAGGEVRCGHLV